jgi:hypothetical protein
VFTPDLAGSLNNLANTLPERVVPPQPRRRIDANESAFHRPHRQYFAALRRSCGRGGHQETPPVKAYWTSSQNKIACEAMLKNAKGISRTIVRPSHTVRTMLPTMFN